MPNIDSSSLIMCLQGLERAIEYNEFLSQSESVEKDDYEEVNYRFELTLNKLAKVYLEEREVNCSLIPLEGFLKYKFVE